MGIAYNTSIVRDGLILYLDAANLKSYSGTGTAWKDISSNGNDLTLVNTPTFSSSNNGTFSFDGVSDYATTGNLGYSSHTISGWINSSMSSAGTGADVSVILGNYAGPQESKYTFIGIEGSGIDWRIDNGVASFALIKKSAFNTNQWYHVALTYNSSTGLAVAYLDGEIVGTRSSTTGIVFDSVPFNVAYQTQDHYFQGSVSNVQVYNRALSAEEMSQNFEAMRGRYGV